ncbi:MAG TPA: STAS domain-containing protein [Miltoncostaea sp.]|nr:STAS domain-containing protein [Miltoncostaea sp.]
MSVRRDPAGSAEGVTLVAADVVGDPAAPDGGLRIDEERDGRTTRLVLLGDLDLAGVGAADAAIRDAMARKGLVVIDLSRLEFIGSEGIRVVLRARDAAEGAGTDLRLIAGGGAARRLIDILGLAERLGVDGGAP